MRYLSFLPIIFSASCLLQVQGTTWGSHYATSSEYIHSNDTMQLVLSQTKKVSLHGPPGSSVTLEFVLINKGLSGHFTLAPHSEDGFSGIMNMPETYLGPGVQQTITVSNMIVPNRKEGDKVRFTLTATRDSGFSKREAPPNQEAPGYPAGGSGVGGSGSYPGGSGVGGSGVGGSGGSYPGGSGAGGSGSYPGGSGGSGSYPGGSGSGGSGSGGSGSYPGPGGSGSFPGGSGGGYYNDPSNRKDVSLTIEYTVSAEGIDDTKAPWTSLEYLAESEEQTCKAKPGQPGCELEYWGVKFTVQDYDTGLHQIKVDPEGREPTGRPIYFRYLNFPIGSNQVHEVVAIASCCTQGMKLRGIDVNGNEGYEDATHEGVGAEGLSAAAMWGIIGGVIALVIIIIVVVVIVVCRKKYSPVPANP